MTPIHHKSIQAGSLNFWPILFECKYACFIAIFYLTQEIYTWLFHSRDLDLGKYVQDLILAWPPYHWSTIGKFSKVFKWPPYSWILFILVYILGYIPFCLTRLSIIFAMEKQVHHFKFLQVHPKIYFICYIPSKLFDFFHHFHHIFLVCVLSSPLIFWNTVLITR